MASSPAISATACFMIPPESFLCGRCRRFTERRLRGRKPRNRYAERRTGNIIQADLVAERNRGGIAAMLAADAELQVLASLAPALVADADEFADTLLVNRHERIGRENAFGRV